MGGGRRQARERAALTSVAAASGKPLSSIKQGEMERTTIEAYQMH